jgi:hypothetical protein
LHIVKHATSSFGKHEEMKGAPSPEKVAPPTQLLMSGVLQKKGLIFWNKRYVTLDSLGILQYFDVKQQKSAAARATIDLTNPLTHILHRTTGTETLKLVTPQQSYVFKTTDRTTNFESWICALETFKTLTKV